MKAGLLECDHVNAEYRAKFGDYAQMFTNLFPELEWTYYDVCNGEFPTDLDECDVYFATGSRRSVYEPVAWIEQLKQLIRALARLDKYFVGCCFGHQLLGEAMGGKVAKSTNGWCVGVHQFTVTKQADWMQPASNSLHLLMMCQDQVQQLPPNAKVWASSEKCPVGIFQVGEKMLGVQAHPEFSKAYDQLLMEMRVERMGEEVVKNGIVSLEQTVDRALIKNWVLNFIGKQNQPMSSIKKND